MPDPVPPIPVLPPDSDKPLTAAYHITLTGRCIRRAVKGPEDSKPVNRQSICIIESRMHKGRWFREIQDLIVDPAQLRLWRNERTIPFDDMKAMHKKLRPLHSPDAGMSTGAFVDSAPDGEDPGLTTGDGPNSRFPMGLSHAYIPTIVPRLSLTLDPVPLTRVAFSMGVGRIVVGFDAVPVSADSFERIHRLTAKPEEHTTRTEEAALTLRYESDWTIAYRDDARFPARGEGMFKLKARARGQRKGRPIDLIAAEDEIKFKFKRVPLGFTKTLAIFAGWKYDLP